MEKEKIVALIVEDMKHNQLLNGLDSIGLMDSERYTLSLYLVIADLMGYKRGNVPDAWQNTYHKTMLSVPNNLTPEEVQSRAIILYSDLSKVQPK